MVQMTRIPQDETERHLLTILQGTRADRLDKRVREVFITKCVAYIHGLLPIQHLKVTNVKIWWAKVGDSTSDSSSG